MNRDLIKNNYIVVKNFLTKEETYDLCTLFKKETLELKSKQEENSAVIGDCVTLENASCFYNVQGTYIRPVSYTHLRAHET